MFIFNASIVRFDSVDGQSTFMFGQELCLQGGAWEEEEENNTPAGRDGAPDEEDQPPALQVRVDVTNTKTGNACDDIAKTGRTYPNSHAKGLFLTGVVPIVCD